MPLRVKMIIGLGLVFVLLLVAMNMIIANSIQSGNEKMIEENLTDLFNNGQIYARQFLIISGENNDGKGFDSVAGETIRELSNVSGNPTGAYSLNGSMLCSTQDGLFLNASYDDLNYAVMGRPAYTLDTNEDQTFAYFSYPVTVAGKSVGILRTMVDYSALYLQGKRMLESLSVVISVAFFAAMVLSVLLMQSFSIPVTKLASISGTLAKSIEQDKLPLGNLDSLLATRRRDEIGKLSRNFADMLRKIDQQMQIIQSDKQELLRLTDFRRRFYDTVTHELKTPLTSIRGYAEVIEDNGFTDPEFFKKAIGHIKQESNRMYRMVVALLELSKLSSSVNYPKEVFDIGRLALEVCEDMQYKAAKYETEIRFNGAQGARVFGSPENLKEVLMNLLDNAIKYKLPQGSVDMVVRSGATVVQVVVSNRAIPIADSEIERLFEPFYQASKQQQREDGSSGLGLAICKQIVEAHAGEIRIMNLPDGIVAVEVTLPLYDGL